MKRLVVAALMLAVVGVSFAKVAFSQSAAPAPTTKPTAAAFFDTSMTKLPYSLY